MDRRGWPWKKKSSDKDKEKDKDKAAEKAVVDKAAEKAVVEKAAEKVVVAPETAAGSLASAGSQGNQDKSKKANYVQISAESYAHLTEMEEEVKTLSDQVSTLHDEVNILNEKLSSAQSEMTTKENIVKQHAKVAEEAVSGWEKAEAEALALKQQLESVTLLKLTAEDRSSHLDGALKECMRQIRNVKDEHEKKLHEIVQTKTKQWDKIKLELEAKLVDFDQQLLRSSAENAAISRSLQERSNMLMKISEEKSHAEAEIEHLKANIESCEREIGSLKYELHISSKELEIRNEERNMSMRSAEVANKQHLEGVKKIAKLESECQRLRSLVRKKLPGPAALAQMKLEVENLGRDYVETRSRRSPGLSPTPSPAPVPEISLENVQQCHKETEFLTSRMLAMEEETKMLKEALAKRNSELQSSRNVCAKTTSKLRSLEAQIQVLCQQKNFPKSNAEVPTEGSSSQNASNPPSLTSMSEDGIDEEGSVAESWATQLISELSHFKKEKNVDRANKTENVNNMELMDDFLEMERLACLPTESNGDNSGSGNVTNKGAEKDDQHVLPNDAKSVNLRSDDPVSSNENLSAGTLESNTNEVPLSRLQSRISMIFESVAKDAHLGRVLEDIKQAVQDIQHALPQDSVTCILGEQLSVDVTGNRQSLAQDSRETAESGNLLTQDSESKTDAGHIIDQDLAIAVSQIHDFVVSVGKEATAIRGIHPNEDELSTKVEEFASSVNKVLCYEMSLANLVLDLSHVLAKLSELNISMPGYKGNEGETNSSDCIDKVTLLEKKVVQDDSMRERLPNGCAHISLSATDTEALREGRSSPGIELKVPSCKCSSQELEQVKLEKDSLAKDLVRCTADLEHSKSQLLATEHLLTELKSQLASCQNSNSLAETQLKCMVESYKLLEKRTQELEAEVNVLHAKNDALNNELQEEKQNHQDALAKCISLQEELQRNEPCPTCSLSAAAETEKNKQEKEIAAAAEKLAECQETIFLLGRQLKALRPSSEQAGSPYNERHQTTEGFVEDEPSPRSLDPNSMFSSQDFDNTELETTSSSYMGRAAPGSPSPSDTYNVPSSPSQTETNHYSRSPINSKRPKHRSTKSSSSSSSGPTPEKHSRGFSRFFSSKTKSAQ